MDVAVSGENAFSSVDPLSIKKDPVVVLTELITDLEANNESAISGHLDSLDQAMTQITNERSNVGAKLNRLDSTEAHLETYKLNFSQMLSDTEDLDLTQAVTDLTAQQSAYQASLASAAKIIQPSLLDYLR